MAGKRAASGSTTLADVAKAAGVAPMTVSRFLNKHPNVTEKTARKIKVAIASLGYAPNHAARVLMGHSSNAIGLIVPNLADAFFATLAHNVQEIARARGYLVWVASSNSDVKIETVLINQMRQHHVDGILLVPSVGQELSSLAPGKTPMVTVDRPMPGGGLDAVIVENRQGAAAAVEHLTEHGYKRIACVGFGLGLFTVDERIEGYRDTMRAHKLDPIVRSDCSDRIETTKALRELIGQNRIEAVFTINNVATVHLIEACDELGLTIPSDLALVGFDDFELAQAMRPRLTVVNQPSEELGRRAARLLFETLASEEKSSSHVSIALPTSLIVRESCGCSRQR